MSKKSKFNVIDPKSADFKAFIKYAFDYYSEIIKLIKRLSKAHDITVEAVIELMKMSPIKYLYDEWCIADFLQRKYMSVKDELKLLGKAKEIVRRAEEEWKQIMEQH